MHTRNFTPLDIAIRNNQSRNVQMLVESGAHRGLGIAAGGSASVVLHCGPTLTATKRMEWTYIYLGLQTIIHFRNSIHSYIFSSDIQIVQSYWKNACLAKKGVEHRVFLLVFLLQDSWGFLKASKEEQRQRSKVRPEGYLMGIWLYKL